MFSVMKHRHVAAAVVHGDRHADHLRHDRAEARDQVRMTLRALVRASSLHLLQQLCVDKRTLLCQDRDIVCLLRLVAARGRSAGRSASCRASGSPASACPTASSGPGGQSAPCPHHHRAGGRPGSSPSRAREAACPSSACGRPCPASPVRAPRCSPGRRWPCSPPARAASHPRADAAGSSRSSFAISWADAPALRTICPPRPDQQLDVVDHRTGGHVAQRQGVADADLSVRTSLDHVVDLQAHRRQDVPLLAVSVEDQRDASRALGVVLNRGDAAGHAQLVALEVDDADAAPRAAATVANRGDATVVAATALALRNRQRRLRRRSS